MRPHVAVPSPLYPSDDEPPIPEDVYDVPPPALNRDKSAAACQAADEVYDTPANLRTAAAARPARQDLYDFPREQEDRGERNEQNIYDVPPQVGHTLLGGGFS